MTALLMVRSLGVRSASASRRVRLVAGASLGARHHARSVHP
jgi:hypothetical protein